MLFLAHIIGRTLTDQMREELRYLRSHGQAAALKEIVEMPDHQADRVLRSIEQNRGKLSNALGNKMPVLRKPGIWADFVEAVSRAFEDGASTDGRVIEPLRPRHPAGT